MQAPAAVWDWYFPAAQLAHVVAPTSEYLPASVQAEQGANDVAENLPGGQKPQIEFCAVVQVRPDVLGAVVPQQEYWPAGTAEHVEVKRFAGKGTIAFPPG